MCEEMRWCKYHEKFEPRRDFRVRKDGYTLGICRAAEAEKISIANAIKNGRPPPDREKTTHPYARNDPKDPLNELMKMFRGPVDPLPWRVSL